MSIKKRLNLLIAVGLSVNTLLPAANIFASENYDVVINNLSTIINVEKTTSGQIEVEEPVTTSSAILVPKNTKFDKTEVDSQLVQIELVLNGSKLLSIANGEVILVDQQDYIIEENVVTIQNTYLAALETGAHTLNFLLTRGEETYVLTQDIQCIDTNEVYLLIDEAELLVLEAPIGTTPGTYYLEDQLIFKEAIAKAKEDIEHVQNQQQVDGIYSKLEKAVGIFKNSIICKEDELNKEALNQLIKEAENLYNDIQIGKLPGMCSESDKVALKNAISDAKDSSVQASTQNHIDEAMENLKEAINTFKNAVIPYITQDINQDGKVNVQDLALVTYYYKAQEQDDNWETARKADVNKDGVINILDLVEVANEMIGK